MTEPRQLKFTTRSIQGVTVAQRTDFTDPDHKGLTLRVTPKGSKTWALLYRRKSDGKKRRVTIGEFPDKELADARTDALELRASIAKGEDPAAARNALRKLETVNDVLDRYLRDYAEPNKRSAKEDRRQFDKDVRPHIGHHKIGTVTRADVLALANQMKDRGAGVGANRTIAALRKAFNWAKGEGYLVGAENPAAGIAPRVREKSRERSLTADEIRRFWIGLETAKMPMPAKLVLKLALVTGQRIGEISGARQGELDLAKSEWLIPAARTKNRKEHAVPLSPLAVKLFREAVTLAGTRPFVFPSSLTRAKSRPLASHRLSHLMFVAREDLKLKDNPATPHDLRRTVATHLAAMGFGESIVARILNHSSIVNRTITGAVYIRHEYAEEKRRALEAWADELDRIIKKRKPPANVVKLHRRSIRY